MGDLSEAVANATLVEAPLLHPVSLPTPSQRRQDPFYKAGKLKQVVDKAVAEGATPPTAAEDEEARCGKPAFALITSCLNKDKHHRKECLKELRARGRHCPELAPVLEQRLLSEACQGVKAVGCGSLLAIHDALAGHETPELLASFLLATKAAYVSEPSGFHSTVPSTAPSRPQHRHPPSFHPPSLPPAVPSTRRPSHTPRPFHSAPPV